MVMRIATKTLYDNGVSQLNTLQGQLQRTQMQLSTGRRVVTPSDDPVASARALEVSQSKEMNTQYVTNRSNAKASLSLVDNTLASTDDLLQEVKSKIVAAGNPAFTMADREALAKELDGRLEDLLGQANATDGSGAYLFSGYKSDIQPFTRSATGATYNGDQGQRDLQVASSRKLAISETGSTIFESNITGNGTFQTSVDPNNYTRGGTGIISPGVVKNPAAVTGHNYTLNFTVVPAAPGVPAATTYTVNDVTSGTAVATGVPYVAGQPIAFDGIQMDVSGVPANGDVFNVDPSKNQSVFETMTTLIAALRGPAGSPQAGAGLTNALNLANQNITNALDNTLSVRASVGARLSELDHLDSAGDDLNLQYSSQLSDLVDLDPVEAISRFTQQQTTLEAAQKSYKALTGLSLFNLI
ncbi:flagellar hook-associated protein FlgL [Pseudoduganella violaceinigra]|uniref:flagellar hook-associated protein FlgL n=1 Tax=Pseudoduganella violaceinigra TaxID=246602 RepID=UPI000421F8B0|nr:flagellar hook-associated protein FlgL [Pseudoduganella violaceinigra]